MLQTRYGCYRGHSVDFRSFVKYECDYAYNKIPKIIVLYNYAYVDKEKCPQILRSSGKHLAAFHYENGVKSGTTKILETLYIIEIS